VRSQLSGLEEQAVLTADEAARVAEAQRADIDELVRQAVATLGAGLAASAGAGDERLVALEERVQQLPESVEARARADEQLQQRLDRLAEWVEAGDRRLRAVEEDVRHAAERQRSELHAQIEGALCDVRSEVTASASATADRLAAVEGQVADLAGMRDELARARGELTDRLGILATQAELAAHAADQDRGRLEALEGTVSRSLDSHASELHGALAEAHAEMATAANRLHALEALVRQREAEVSELAAVQAALDGGLGQIRSELEGLRATTDELVRAGADPGRDEQANEEAAQVADRLRTLERRLDETARVRASLEHAPRPRGGRGATLHRPAGRGSAASDLAALSDVAERLVWRHDQLEMRMAMVEQAADAAARASASQVAALKERLEAQAAALVAADRSGRRVRPKSARTTDA
jgi:predicted nuclease with TOPRIM domain